MGSAEASSTGAIFMARETRTENHPTLQIVKVILAQALSEAAALVEAHAIATRNKKDFGGAPLAVYAPAELLNLLDRP